MIASRRSLPRRGGVPLSTKIDLQNHGCGHARAHHSRVTWVPLSSMNAQKLSLMSQVLESPGRVDTASAMSGDVGSVSHGGFWWRRRSSGAWRAWKIERSGVAELPKLPGQTRIWTHADSTSGNMSIPSVACGIADVSTDARVTYECARLEANAAQRCRRDA